MSIRTDFISKVYPLTKKQMLTDIFDLKREIQSLREDMLKNRDAIREDMLKNRDAIWLLNNPFKFKLAEWVMWNNRKCIVCEAKLGYPYPSYTKWYDIMTDKGEHYPKPEDELTPCSTN